MTKPTASVSADLHTRLRAAVQEKLDLAKAATPGPWSYDGNASAVVVGGEEGRSLCASAYNWPDPICAANAAYIAAHGPAAMIRIHEAALRVLERHRRRTFGSAYLPEVLEPQREDPWCRTCRGTGWPCAAIRDLAAAYGVPVDTEETSA